MSTEAVGDVVVDTGVVVPVSAYVYKLLHPLLHRWGRYLLFARQRRRYFVMAGDYVSNYTAQFGAFEAEEIAITRRVCLASLGDVRMERAVFFDVGCHIGNYSVELGPSFGRTVAIDAMQPLAHVTRANLSWNGLDSRSTVICAAISDREGELSMQIERDGNLGHARVAPEGSAVKVRATSLDILAADLQCVDVGLIKFDVEGHEIEALKGSVKTIARCQPVIQVEVDRNNLQTLLDVMGGTGVTYTAWQVTRGDRGQGAWRRLWTALRRGGNPVYLRRLSPTEANSRHMPCVLLVPESAGQNWTRVFSNGAQHGGAQA